MKGAHQKPLAAALAALLLFAVILASCEYGANELFGRPDDVNERAVSLAEVPPPAGAAGRYTCLVLSDVHFGAPEDAPIESLFSWLGGLSPKPAFCAVLGDLVESGREEQYRAFQEFAGRLVAENIPVYSIAGNHDLYNSGWTHWKTYVKPHTSYYRIKTHGFSFYFLDSANGTHGQNQLADFTGRAKDDPNPKVVFTHYPVCVESAFYFSLSNTRERALLIDTFARTGVKWVLTGHDHKGDFADLGAFRETSLKAFRQRRAAYILSIDEAAQTADVTEYGL